MTSRKLTLAAVLIASALGLASCGGGDKKAPGAMPTEITFSILSAEGQASNGSTTQAGLPLNGPAAKASMVHWRIAISQAGHRCYARRTQAAKALLSS